MQQGWGTPRACRSRFPPCGPTKLEELGGFLVQFSTEAGESTLFLIAQALDSSIAGVPLMPYQFLSIGCVWRAADPVLWGGAGQAKLETLFSVSPTQACLNRAGPGM